MVAFDVFGSVPVLVYVVARVAGSQPDKNLLFGLAAVATAFTLFALGVTKASITKQKKVHSGCMMLANGSCAAAVAYGIGATFESILRVDRG